MAGQLVGARNGSATVEIVITPEVLAAASLGPGGAFDPDRIYDFRITTASPNAVVLRDGQPLVPGERVPLEDFEDARVIVRLTEGQSMASLGLEYFISIQSGSNKLQLGSGFGNIPVSVVDGAVRDAALVGVTEDQIANGDQIEVTIDLDKNDDFEGVADPGSIRYVVTQPGEGGVVLDLAADGVLDGEAQQITVRIDGGRRADVEIPYKVVALTGAEDDPATDADESIAELGAATATARVVDASEFAVDLSGLTGTVTEDEPATLSGVVVTGPSDVTVELTITGDAGALVKLPDTFDPRAVRAVEGLDGNGDPVFGERIVLVADAKRLTEFVQSVEYRPAPDDFGAGAGALTFSLRPLDADPVVIEATATFDIAAVDDAPVANRDVIEIAPGTSLTPTTVTASAFLGNDVDVDGDTITITGISPRSALFRVNVSGDQDPSSGLVIQPASSVTPFDGSFGIDRLAYAISDGTGESVVADAFVVGVDPATDLTLSGPTAPIDLALGGGTIEERVGALLREPVLERPNGTPLFAAFGLATDDGPTRAEIDATVFPDEDKAFLANNADLLDTVRTATVTISDPFEASFVLNPPSVVLLEVSEAPMAAGTVTGAAPLFRVESVDGAKQLTAEHPAVTEADGALTIDFAALGLGPAEATVRLAPAGDASEPPVLTMQVAASSADTGLPAAVLQDVLSRLGVIADDPALADRTETPTVTLAVEDDGPGATVRTTGPIEIATALDRDDIAADLDGDGGEADFLGQVKTGTAGAAGFARPFPAVDVRDAATPDNGVPDAAEGLRAFQLDVRLDALDALADGEAKTIAFAGTQLFVGRTAEGFALGTAEPFVFPQDGGGIAVRSLALDAGAAGAPLAFRFVVDVPSEGEPGQTTPQEFLGFAQLNEAAGSAPSVAITAYAVRFVDPTPGDEDLIVNAPLQAAASSALPEIVPATAAAVEAALTSFAVESGTTGAVGLSLVDDDGAVSPKSEIALVEGQEMNDRVILENGTSETIELSFAELAALLVSDDPTDPSVQDQRQAIVDELAAGRLRFDNASVTEAGTPWLSGGIDFPQQEITLSFDPSGNDAYDLQDLTSDSLQIFLTANAGTPEETTISGFLPFDVTRQNDAPRLERTVFELDPVTDDPDTPGVETASVTFTLADILDRASDVDGPQDAIEFVEFLDADGDPKNGVIQTRAGGTIKVTDGTVTYEAPSGVRDTDVVELILTDGIDSDGDGNSDQGRALIEFEIVDPSSDIAVLDPLDDGTGNAPPVRVEIDNGNRFPAFGTAGREVGTDPVRLVTAESRLTDGEPEILPGYTATDLFLLAGERLGFDFARIDPRLAEAAGVVPVLAGEGTPVFERLKLADDGAQQSRADFDPTVIGVPLDPSIDVEGRVESAVFTFGAADRGVPAGTAFVINPEQIFRVETLELEAAELEVASAEPVASAVVFAPASSLTTALPLFELDESFDVEVSPVFTGAEVIETTGTAGERIQTFEIVLPLGLLGTSGGVFPPATPSPAAALAAPATTETPAEGDAEPISDAELEAVIDLLAASLVEAKVKVTVTQANATAAPVVALEVTGPAPADASVLNEVVGGVALAGAAPQEDGGDASQGALPLEVVGALTQSLAVVNADPATDGASFPVSLELLDDGPEGESARPELEVELEHNVTDVAVDLADTPDEDPDTTIEDEAVARANGGETFVTLFPEVRLVDNPDPAKLEGAPAEALAREGGADAADVLGALALETRADGAFVLNVAGAEIAFDGTALSTSTPVMIPDGVAGELDVPAGAVVAETTLGEGEAAQSIYVVAYLEGREDAAPEDKVVRLFAVNGRLETPQKQEVALAVAEGADPEAEPEPAQIGLIPEPLGTDLAEAVLKATTLSGFDGARDVELFLIDDDGNTSATATVRALSPENQPPVFTGATSLDVPENVTGPVVVLSDPDAVLSAADPEGQALAFEIVGGADAAAFTIDQDSGALSLVMPANFEAPASADGDNDYEVIVRAREAAAREAAAREAAGDELATDQNITVTVADAANEIEIPPASIPLPDLQAGAPLTGLNLRVRDAILTEKFRALLDPSSNILIDAAALESATGVVLIDEPSDPDDGTVEITTEDDVAAGLRRFDPVTLEGTLDDLNAFLASGAVRYTTDADTTIPAASVALLDDQGAPIFDDDGNPLSQTLRFDVLPNLVAADFTVDENGRVVATLVPSDADIAQTSLSIATDLDGNPLRDGSLFEIDALGRLVFLAAPDFENPQDGLDAPAGGGLGSPVGSDGNNVYNLVVRVEEASIDPTVPGVVNDVPVTITVEDVNEPPRVSSALLVAPTNREGVGFAELVFTDPDAGGTVVVSLLDDANGAFTVEPDGVLRIGNDGDEVDGDLDAILPGQYEIVVAADDTPQDPNDPLTTLDVAVLVSGDGRVPSSPAPGLVIASFFAEDVATEISAFSLLGSFSDAFEIVPRAGQSSVADIVVRDTGSVPDFGATTAFDLFVVRTLADGTQSRVLIDVVVDAVTPNGTPPELTPELAFVAIDENTTAVQTFTVTDADAGDQVTLSLFDPSNLAALPRGDVERIIADLLNEPAAAGLLEQAEQVLSAAGILLPAGSMLTADVLVTALSAFNDQDLADFLTDVLEPGFAALQIDEDGRTLEFAAAPDFEAPAGIFGSNLYAAVVLATDAAGNADRSLVVVDVTDDPSDTPVPQPDVDEPTIGGDGQISRVRLAPGEDSFTLDLSDAPGATLDVEILDISGLLTLATLGYVDDEPFDLADGGLVTLDENGAASLTIDVDRDELGWGGPFGLLGGDGNLFAIRATDAAGNSTIELVVVDPQEQGALLA